MKHRGICRSLQFLIEPINNFLNNINVPIDSLESAQSLLSNVAGFITDTIIWLSRVQDTANLLIGAMMVPIFLFFWLWDSETLSSGFLKFVPKKKKFLSKFGQKQMVTFKIISKVNSSKC